MCIRDRDQAHNNIEIEKNTIEVVDNFTYLRINLATVSYTHLVFSVCTHTHTHTHKEFQFVVIYRRQYYRNYYRKIIFKTVLFDNLKP